MSFDSWKTQCDDARDAYEIKNETDVSKKNYRCSIDKCPNKAIREVSLGHSLNSGYETTYLLCNEHEFRKWEIYFEDLREDCEHF